MIPTREIRSNAEQILHCLTSSCDACWHADSTNAFNYLGLLGLHFCSLPSLTSARLPYCLNIFMDDSCLCAVVDGYLKYDESHK